MSTRVTIIAVVEDDASMQKSIERLLSAHGFAAEVYASAEDFLTRPGTAQAACALIDINLPGMTGIELRRQLARLGSSLPVIFMTAVDNEDTQREALASGCLAYLQKPFSARLLVDAINRVAA